MADMRSLRDPPALIREVISTKSYQARTFKALSPVGMHDGQERKRSR